MEDDRIVLRESFSEIRNAQVSMSESIRKFAHGAINDVQFSLEIAREIERQGIWLRLLEREEKL